MRDAISTTPESLKIVLRTVGTLNVILALLGASFLVGSVHRFLTVNAADESIPYFRFAFIAMTSMNVVFLGVLLVTAIQFMRGRITSINLYSASVLALFLYSAIIAVIWRWGARTDSAAFRDAAMSVAAATGIGNSGVALFEFLFLVPYLYPLTSIVLLHTFRYRYRSQHSPISA